ncbi:MAG: multifunctional CCA addition/repair protein [Gammaproteobacteria bacterium]|nr:multifunctional CCA addition/repair protein [Gammaproteobacteria bacterium]MDH3560065.1 multifunctional CCA addition/repair protein [Gammaproteobacteria bacterium]
MEIYLVGGAVRDKRLGLPVSECDWVVVGSTPGEMLKQGYMPVGKDFPVFLHPQTKDEYALARTERKTGPGYTGFETCADPDITLEQDLLRRDLTINAMAETPEGELIDPYGGLDDLENGVLRHVSPAFSEDPVRILRVARFAARFDHWGFRVAHETNALMRHMVGAGEVDHLVPERVWAELVKALAEKTPARFFDVLYGCGALAKLFPEVESLYIATDRPGHGHKDDIFPVLQAAVRLSDDPAIRFAALVCDTGLGTPALDRLCERLRAPNAYRELASLAIGHRGQAHGVAELAAGDVLHLLVALDAFRRPQRFEDFLQVCRADADAHHRDHGGQYPQAELLRRAYAAAREVDTGALAGAGLSGPAIGQALREQRIKAIELLLQ